MNAPRPSNRLVLVAIVTALSACESATDVVDEPLGPGDPLLGEVAFRAECASCHASGDGLDLAFFGFSDFDIVRRAVAHVDSATARDIVAYVHTLPEPAAAEDERIFQPGGRVLSGDVELAMELFGGDAWPLDLTSAELAAIDPLETPTAIPFPIWSLEGSDLDWMPDVPLAASVTGYRSGLAGAAIDRYYATGSLQHLLEAIALARTAERAPDNPVAPCVTEPIERFDADECFEARRWIASLGAQYMLRFGIDAPIHRVLHDGWWDVGNAARISTRIGQPVSQAVVNWVQWMWAGWVFAPEAHASVYLASGLSRVGLARHAAFHVLRTQVARAPTARQAFDDARNVARFAPAHWVYPTLRLAYQRLLEGLDVAPPPGGDALAEARRATEDAFTIASVRLDDEERLSELRTLRDRVLAALD